MQHTDLDRLAGLRGHDAREAEARPERGAHHRARLEKVPAGVTRHVVSFPGWSHGSHGGAASLARRDRPGPPADLVVRLRPRPAARAIPNRSVAISLRCGRNEVGVLLNVWARREPLTRIRAAPWRSPPSGAGCPW